MTKKIALITGATSGIGKACALKFAENGYDIIITGRRAELLENLSQEIKQHTSADVCILNFDIRNQEENVKAIASLQGKWREIDVLVNNAGLAVGLNPIDKGIIDDWERMIDTNIKGLLYISREVMPLMTQRKKGHIINIGSIAGKDTYANGNVYCATKAAVDSLSKAMRIDLLSHNIKVTVIHPGACETEFSIVRFKGNHEIADGIYKGFKPLSGMDVAETVFYVSNLPEHVNINELIVLPTAQANTIHTFKTV